MTQGEREREADEQALHWGRPGRSHTDQVISTSVPAGRFLTPMQVLEGLTSPGNMSM